MKLKNWNYPYIKKIIAIDFDGTLTTGDTRKWEKNKCISPDIMIPNLPLIKKLIEERDNYYLILWTTRYGKHLKKAIKFCEEFGLYFDAINKNIVPFKSSKKIIADYYLDDKSIEIETFMKKIMYNIKNTI